MSLLLLFSDAPTVTTPADDDGDTTVTTFTDHDGNVVRPARLECMHAMDSGRNADLHGIDRLPQDRYRVQSSRQGRTPTAGTTLRLWLHAKRAGDVFAVRETVVRYSISSRRFRLKTDTTNRTDVDGATVRIPTLTAFHSADSMLNAALAMGGADRDRFTTVHDLDTDKAVGALHRLFLSGDGRAGNAWAVREIVVRFSVTDARTDKKAET